MTRCWRTFRWSAPRSWPTVPRPTISAQYGWRTGIGVNVHYIPGHTQPFWQARGLREGDFLQSEAYYAEAISIPLYAGLTEGEQDRVVAALAAALA